MSALQDLGGGMWRWALRHPEWHPRTTLGAEVGCYVAHEGGGTVLIDPLLDEAVAAELDAVVRGEVVIAVTIPYHVRSAVAAAERWGGTVIGHPDVARRLKDATPFYGGDEPPLGLRKHRVARTKEQPLELPEARALAFGDRVVGVDGGLRVWLQRRLDEAQRRAWFESIAVPGLRPLLEIDTQRVLVTHGPPVLTDGRRALDDALSGEPWYHRPS